MIQLFEQLAVATLLLAGWGFWIWFSTGRQALQRRGWWVWCLLGGAATHTLILQQLWYLDLRLSITSWVSGAVALAGVVGWLREYVRCLASRRSKISPLFKAVASLSLFVCAVHGWSIASRGPGHYYGRAEYDQFNYVVTAQFLIDHKPFKSAEKITDDPLMLKVAETSEQRIAQSILHAELSVLSLCDAQEGYGAATLLFLLLLGLAVMGYLLAVNVSSWAAAIGGALVVALPAITAVQLNCFFSQTSVLWTLIALPGILARSPWSWREAIIGGSILGFLLGAYTEIAPFGFGTAFLAIVLIVPRSKRVVTLGILLLVALGLNIGFLGRAGDFLVSQLTEAHDAKRLASWMPGSGSWSGFGRNFAPDLPNGLLSLVGLLVGIFILLSLWQTSAPLRARFSILLALPLAAVAAMLLLPTFPAYAFGKLLISVTPLFFSVIVVAAFKQRSPLRPLFFIFIGCISALSLWESVVAQKEIVEGTDKIARVDLRSAMQMTTNSQNRDSEPPVFLISAEDALTAGWLCYYRRNNIYYLTYQEMSDRIFPSAWHAFRRPPSGLTNLYSATATGLSPFPSYNPYPKIKVLGGTPHKNGMVEMWTSEGELTFDIAFTRVLSGRLRWFCFDLNTESGRDPPFEVVVDTPDGAGVVSSGRLWAIPARMEAERYVLKLRNKTGGPFSITFYGLEPIHQPPRLPYRFEPVKLSAPKLGL